MTSPRAVVATASLIGAALATPAVTAPATAATPAGPSHRCASSADVQPGETVVRTLVSDGRTRTYRVHVPRAYDGRRALPVVLAFHGRGSTGVLLEGYSGLSRLPAVTVYPEGVVGKGDDGRQAWQGAPYSAPGVDDVMFTRDLLTDLSRRSCVDLRRVYATGKSNGGGFVNLLACRLPDRVAAVAPVAAAVYSGTTSGCASAPPKPVLAMHGTDDVTIPYAGDEDRGLPAISTWVRGWAAKAGCQAQPRTRTFAWDVVDSRYRECGSNPVGLVSIMGGGHTWPGEDAYSGGGYATQSVEAADLAWAFFRRHQLPATTIGGRA